MKFNTQMDFAAVWCQAYGFCNLSMSSITEVKRKVEALRKMYFGFFVCNFSTLFLCPDSCQCNVATLKNIYPLFTPLPSLHEDKLILFINIYINIGWMDIHTVQKGSWKPITFFRTVHWLNTALSEFK